MLEIIPWHHISYQILCTVSYLQCICTCFCQLSTIACVFCFCLCIMDYELLCNLKICIPSLQYYTLFCIKLLVESSNANEFLFHIASWCFNILNMKLCIKVLCVFFHLLSAFVTCFSNLLLENFLVENKISPFHLNLTWSVNGICCWKYVSFSSKGILRT